MTDTWGGGGGEVTGSTSRVGGPVAVRMPQARTALVRFGCGPLLWLALPRFWQLAGELSLHRVLQGLVEAPCGRSEAASDQKPRSSVTGAALLCFIPHGAPSYLVGTKVLLGFLFVYLLPFFNLSVSKNKQ